MRRVKFKICGKTLIQKYFRPPFHRHQISKPLMSEFVSNNCHDSLSITVRRLACIPEYGSFPETFRSLTKSVYFLERKFQNVSKLVSAIIYIK